MHKNTKLFPFQRIEIYQSWKNSASITFLAKEYHVSRTTIYKVIKRARLRIFINSTSTNKRFLTVKYGLRNLTKTQLKVSKIVARRERRNRRYERSVPGELVHLDTKRLPLLRGEAKTDPREYLFVAIDDHSRWLYADIFPDKTAYSSAIFVDEMSKSIPFNIHALYSDNGSEYRGSKLHPLVQWCEKHEIKQYYTKVKHPWTNGKAERVIRTLMEEWHPRTRCNHNTRDQRRRYLYAYVNWYNQNRHHQTIDSTPLQRLQDFLISVNNA